MPKGLATLAFASAGLLHPHVPFDEAANLTLGIAASHHARDKLAVVCTENLDSDVVVMKSAKDRI